MRLSVTGHRPDRLGGYTSDVTNRLRHLALLSVARLEPSQVVVGMAQGWDQACAWAALDLGVPFVAVLPGFIQPDAQVALWPPAARAEYARLLALADEIEQRPWPGARREYHDRDMRLVERGDEVLALWDGDPRSGTGMTIRMAGGKPVHNVWGEWHAGQ